MRNQAQNHHHCIRKWRRFFEEKHRHLIMPVLLPASLVFHAHRTFHSTRRWVFRVDNRRRDFHRRGGWFDRLLGSAGRKAAHRQRHNQGLPHCISLSNIDACDYHIHGRRSIRPHPVPYPAWSGRSPASHAQSSFRHRRMPKAITTSQPMPRMQSGFSFSVSCEGFNISTLPRDRIKFPSRESARVSAHDK
jgi:hypothetical protein